jgi:CubicO group peptidase (beta-lactamase class C family)
MSANRRSQRKHRLSLLAISIIGGFGSPTIAAHAEEGLPPAVCRTAPASATPQPKAREAAISYRPFPATWQRALERFVKDGNVPGVAVIVKSPDWGVRASGVGEANLANHQPMAPTLQFRIGSVTKTFLAQVILRLDQEGKLRLSDPVLKHLGDNQIVAGIPNIDKLNIASLMRMTSGIANYLDAPAIATSPQLTPLARFSPDDLAKVLSATGQASGKPPVAPYFKPDQTFPNPYWATILQGLPATPAPAPYPLWNYSNSNYLLLGMIAEKVTGRPAAEIFQRYVFGPLGLKDTYFATDSSQMPEIHGYTKWGSIPYPKQVYDSWCDVTVIDPSFAWTAGAIISTPFDLLKFEEAIFTTEKLLNAGTKAKWLTFVSADIHPGWEPMQYGTGGVMQIERPYGNARGHGGAFAGYKTLIYHFFDQKTSFVLATNTWDEEWEVKILDELMPHVNSAVTTPQPKAGANAAVGRDGKLRLAWQAGRIETGTYMLYWGTDLDTVESASTDHRQGVETLSTDTPQADVKVDPNKTYYWRVDTVVADKARPLVIGPTWQFRTARGR